MGRQKWSWRVVGITPAALRKFEEQDFRYVSRCGITRAHITPRIVMVTEIMSTPTPMSEDELFAYWLAHDKTIICARGENIDPVPEHIAIANDSGDLFTSQKIAGFSVKAAEREFLRTLAANHLQNKNPQTKENYIDQRIH